MDETLQAAALELSDASRDFVAGGIAGMAGVTAGQPLDTLRVRQQSQPSLGRLGLYELTRSVVTSEGPRALFKGMGGPVTSSALQNAVLFQTFGSATRWLESSGLLGGRGVGWGSTGSAGSEVLEGRPTGAAGTGSFGAGGEDHPREAAMGDGEPHPPLVSFPGPRLLMPLLAGSLSGAVQALLVTPVDLVKVRLQLQRAVPGQPGYRGPLKILAGIWKGEGGVRGIYRGLGPCLWRETISYGVYFAAFESIRDVLAAAVAGAGVAPTPPPGPAGAEAARDEPAPPSPSPTVFTPAALATCVAGGTAGMLSWLSVYPIDVVKTRMQASSRDDPLFATMGRAFSTAWGREGLDGFTRGLGATLQRAALVNGIIFFVYEEAHATVRGERG